jgi:hypothetical protein
MQIVTLKKLAKQSIFASLLSVFAACSQQELQITEPNQTSNAVKASHFSQTFAILNVM